MYLERDLRPLEARQAGVRTLAEALSRLAQQMGCVPLLDPKEDMKVCVCVSMCQCGHGGGAAPPISASVTGIE